RRRAIGDVRSRRRRTSGPDRGTGRRPGGQTPAMAGRAGRPPQRPLRPAASADALRPDVRRAATGGEPGVLRRRAGSAARTRTRCRHHPGGRRPRGARRRGRRYPLRGVDLAARRGARRGLVGLGAVRAGLAGAHRATCRRRRRCARRRPRPRPVQGAGPVNGGVRRDTAVDRIRAVFADAGCTGWLHARRCADPRAAMLSVRGDERVVLASVYKLPLFLAFCAEVDAGRLDASGQLRIVPSDCTPGPTGIASFRDPVTTSRRDVAAAMMTVADNAAADVLRGETGRTGVEGLLARLGHARTRIVGGTADVYQRLVEETDTRTTVEAFRALTDIDAAWTVSAYDPAYTSATTPEEMTRLLEAVWSGSALSPESTAFAQQV